MILSELRIGNLISPFGKSVTRVEYVCGWNKLIGSSNFSERDIEDFEGIEISHEWLLNLGFNRYGEDDSFFIVKNKDIYFVNLIIENNSLFYRFFINDKRLDANIRYVHQLQNLFFSLTESELILDEKIEKDLNNNID